MIPLVDLKAQYRATKDEIDQAIARVLENTNFILGEEVVQFEEAFAEFCAAEYAVGVGSGTAALHLALLACGVRPGDEVITTPFTFIATVEAISHCGARPVFADIDPQSYTIDPNHLEDEVRKRNGGRRPTVSGRPKAIIPVHLYGQPADMDAILTIARRYGLKVIEDAAQAHGAEYKGRRVGTLGDAACFSFYPAKNLGAYGDGGAVVTNQPEIARRVRLLRDHGRESKYKHREIGYGERLDALQAAILSVKLRHLDHWTEERRAAAQRYNKLLRCLPVKLPTVSPYARHVYHLYVARVPDRDKVVRLMKADKIGIGIHYPIPVHLQPSYKSLGHKLRSFPEAENAAAEVLSLPLYPELSEAVQLSVVESLRRAIRGC